MMSNDAVHKAGDAQSPRPESAAIYRATWTTGDALWRAMLITIILTFAAVTLHLKGTTESVRIWSPFRLAHESFAVKPVASKFGSIRRGITPQGGPITVSGRKLPHAYSFPGGGEAVLHSFRKDGQLSGYCALPDGSNAGRITCSLSADGRGQLWKSPEMTVVGKGERFEVSVAKTDVVRFVVESLDGPRLKMGIAVYDLELN